MRQPEGTITVGALFGEVMLKCEDVALDNMICICALLEVPLRGDVIHVMGNSAMELLMALIFAKRQGIKVNIQQAAAEEPQVKAALHWNQQFGSELLGHGNKKAGTVGRSWLIGDLAWIKQELTGKHPVLFHSFGAISYAII